MNIFTAGRAFDVWLLVPEWTNEDDQNDQSDVFVTFKFESDYVAGRRKVIRITSRTNS